MKLETFHLLEMIPLKMYQDFLLFINRGLLKEKHLLKKVIKSKNKSEKFIQEIFWKYIGKGGLRTILVYGKVIKRVNRNENNLSNVEKNYKMAISSKTR